VPRSRADRGPAAPLTHADAGGPRMVDVSAKPETAREATAEGSVRMAPGTARLISGERIKKGSVLDTARLAGVMAAKRTADLIPLCHPLGLDHVAVEAEVSVPEGCVRVRATARCIGRTGVEMEALTAVAVACLTIYDMAKAHDRGMEITAVRLLRKSGGASGVWEREP